MPNSRAPRRDSARCISSLTSTHPLNWPCHRTREEGRYGARRENSIGRSLLLAPWSSLYQWMLVWRRRHASLSFQRAVTPTRLTRTKRTATYTLCRPAFPRNLPRNHPRNHPRNRPPPGTPLSGHPLPPFYVSLVVLLSFPSSSSAYTHTRAHTLTLLWTPVLLVVVIRQRA